MNTSEYRDPRYPCCACFAELDMQLRKFKNGTLHTYSVCSACGTRASRVGTDSSAVSVPTSLSPCPRHHVPSLQKWRELCEEQENRQRAEASHHDDSDRTTSEMSLFGEV